MTFENLLEKLNSYSHYLTSFPFSIPLLPSFSSLLGYSYNSLRMPGSHTQWTMNACVQLIAELRSNATNYQQHPDVWVHLQMTVHSGLQPSCMYQGAEYSSLCMLCPVFWWIECTNTSLAPLHFGVICYVDLTGTMVFIKFIERFVWAFTLENEGKGKLIKGPLYGGKSWWLVCFRVNGLVVSWLVSCEWPLMSVQVSPLH